jgi:hypothetical protein
MPEWVSFVSTADVRDGDLFLYGSSSHGIQMGARITAQSGCVVCGGPLLAGEHITAELAPDMLGTARHTGCSVSPLTGF